VQSVIYVDDDADIREVVAAALGIIGKLDVRTAASGQRAIELAHESKPDLVLMDVMIPGLDGPSILKLLRENPETADIPVIFMTAKVMPTEVADLLRLGALGVIRKPFDPMTLCSDLFALWKQAKPAGAAAVDPGAAPAAWAKIESLSESFLRRTAVDAAVLERLIEAGQGGDRTAFLEIERLSHSIHGTGAMFGFPALSAAAASMERLALIQTAQSSGPLTAAEEAMVRQLRDGVVQLKRRLAEAEIIQAREAALLQA
jgi:CheY-like chemotaxis protein